MIALFSVVNNTKINFKNKSKIIISLFVIRIKEQIHILNYLLTALSK